jgi:anaerobic selenocysteine-containing dehydrogenase
MNISEDIVADDTTGQELADLAPATLPQSIHRSFCRICTNNCAIKVAVSDGRVVEVKGDTADPLYAGFTCIKGRAQPQYLYSPDRLLRPLKRTQDGFTPIPMVQAIDEIGEKLLRIRDRHGPRAIADWSGTMLTATAGTSMPFLMALMDAIGSPFRFDPNTIDKGGKQVAASLLGQWNAPSFGFDRPDVAMFIGINPMVTCTGFPAGNPGLWLKQMQRRGMNVIVIDPRRSDVAERAALHLQPRPGFDAQILAAMLRTILIEQLFDIEFVEANVRGVGLLRRTVEPFTPERVGAMADLRADEIVAAARLYATASRGFTMAGTGPHMSGPGSLVEYLVLALETLCGNWMREGDVIRAEPSLLPTAEYRAQASDPSGNWAFGERFVRNLSQSAAGLPSAALIDHMLLDDDRRIRALISFAGNPAIAMPDHQKTLRALRSLDLLVQIDPWMSATSQLAHYILTPTMPLETAGSTIQLDRATGRATGYGLGQSYAQFSPALVDPPEGADVWDEWRMFHAIGQRMGFELSVKRPDGTPVSVMPETTTASLIEELATGSRVPFALIRETEGGQLYPDDTRVVLPKQTGWEGRLDVGAGDMLSDLATLETTLASPEETPGFPLRLVCRRHRHVFNSSCNIAETNRGKRYNPAFVNPSDLDALGLVSGDLAILASPYGEIAVIVEAEADIRAGLVSIAFAYGGIHDPDGDPFLTGSNVNALLSNEEHFDRYTGQPRMSNVPVRLSPAKRAA